MHKVKVEVHWSDKNYCCGYTEEGVGTLFCTSKTLEGLKAEFEETLAFHVEGMQADGDQVPEWLVNKEYEIEYTLDVSALLRSLEPYISMAAISRVTGINQKQLSHYASSLKIPRPAQREKIIAGIQSIGQTLLAVK